MEIFLENLEGDLEGPLLSVYNQDIKQYNLIALPRQTNHGIDYDYVLLISLTTQIISDPELVVHAALVKIKQDKPDFNLQQIVKVVMKSKYDRFESKLVIG